MANITCNICHCNLALDQISALKCGHTFHLNCVNGWLEKSQSCPTCRVEILGVQNGDIIAKLFLEISIDQRNAEDSDKETQFTLLLECMSDLGAKFENSLETTLITREDIGDLNKKVTSLIDMFRSFTDSYRHMNEQILTELASIRDKDNNVETEPQKDQSNDSAQGSETGVENRNVEVCPHRATSSPSNACGDKRRESNSKSMLMMEQHKSNLTSLFASPVF